MSFHPAMDYGRGRHQSARALPEEGPPFVYTADRRAREMLDLLASTGSGALPAAPPPVPSHGGERGARA